MMPTLTSPSVLSAPQRRCRVLLTLFQPGQIATTETFSALNGVDDEIAREDITETGLEIQRYHRLAITTGQNGRYRIEGCAQPTFVPFTLAQTRLTHMPDFHYATVYAGIKNRA